MAQRLIDDTKIAALDALLLSLETILAELRATPVHTDPVVVPEEPAGIAPTASFTASPVSGASPLTVQFTNNSTGTAPLTYKWDMSDGSGNLPENTQKDPKWKFWTSPKKYTITLTVTNKYGTHTLTRPDYISVGTIPTTTPTTTGDTIPTYGAPETVGGYAIGG
jgi:PKD repeat protein